VTQEVEACALGAGQCDWDEGCGDGLCGACGQDAPCAATEVCLADGSCGACAQDAQCAPGRSCVQGVCLEALPSWDLEIAPEDWRELYANPYEDLEQPCALVVDGVRYVQGCTVRVRGGTSRDYPKKSLRIKFPRGAAHPGLSRRINLRSEYNDPTYLRTWLGYEVFRRLTDLPTPRTRFVRLSLNGEFYGLFQEVEYVGEDFLEARGLDGGRPMYEADPEVEDFRAGVTAMVPLPEPALYAAGWQQKTGPETGLADLRYLIERVLAQDMANLAPGTWGPTRASNLAEHAHLPRVLDYLAVMAVIQNHDHVKKNFHISRQVGPDGRERWEIYPWDLDLSFGCLWDEANQDTLCDELLVGEDPERGVIPDGYAPLYPFEPYANVLIHVVLRDPALHEHFAQRVCQMLGSSLWSQRLPTYIDAWEQWLAGTVGEDQEDLLEGVQAHRVQVQGLRDFLRGRAAFLRQRYGCR
jgi:spore coat protein H